MRLIDADKLQPDRMSTKGGLCISQSQIANAKTIEAMPMEQLNGAYYKICEVVDSMPFSISREQADTCLKHEIYKILYKR